MWRIFANQINQTPFTECETLQTNDLFLSRTVSKSNTIYLFSTQTHLWKRSSHHWRSRIQYWKTLENVLPSVCPTPVGPSNCLDLWNSRGAPRTRQHQGGTKECRTFESQQKLCTKWWQPSEVRRSPSDVSFSLLLPNLLSKANNVEILHFSNNPTQQNSTLISKAWERSSGWCRV